MLTHRHAAGASRGLVCVAGLIAICAPAFCQQGPDLGIVATPEQVAAWDLSIGPDGAGLPPGSGDARTGAQLYAAQCIACHGPQGSGALNAKLAGGHGTLASDAPVRTIGSYWPYATTVFDYIRRAMPFTQPLSLSNDEVYALTAYLLYINDIIDENDVMNSATLPAVKMPNRDGFIIAYPELEE
jgi:cytochrome c